MKPARAFAAILFVAACAPVAATGRVGAPEVAASDTSFVQRHTEVHWVRTAAEHDAIFHQVFRVARERLGAQAAGRARGTWAIISDADETLIDNSEYQRRRAAVDGSFDAASWRSWVRERAAPALPGAVEYVRHVRSLGGRVVVVSNRNAEECDDTRANLAAVELEVDLVLCRAATSDKNPRFESVRQGTASPSLPPLEVLQWVGDNIQDFPRMTQASRGSATALAQFGDRWFILPNPMYGSFERNPPR